MGACAGAVHIAWRARQAANMCYIIFTSGSTGRPKGTVLQHTSVINYLLGMVRCAPPPTSLLHDILASSMCA